MIEVLKIGSIISIDDKKGMIAGYLDYIDNERLKYRYIVVPYPGGYTSPASLRVVDIENYDVEFNGFENDYSTAITTAISGIIDVSNEYTYKEMVDILRTYRIGGAKNE